MNTGISLTRILFFALALGGSASALAAQQVLTNPSVADLVRELSPDDEGPSAKRLDFARTAPPNPGTHLCAGSDAAGRASGGSANKTLEVVPYAAEGAANVNLAIQFETGTDKLSSSDQGVLNRLANALQQRELLSVRFAVAGHTDRVGGDEINLPLSCARANSVRKYLISRGVAADRLHDPLSIETLLREAAHLGQHST